jgi:NADH:ubiquinone oxidoreductase subunit C
MTNDALKVSITALHIYVEFDESSEWLNVVIKPEEWKGFAKELRFTNSLNFDYLFCLTCVDWKTHLTMVYHLSSTAYRNAIVVKAKLDRDNPRIETVSDIWKTAEFHEREVFDLFGVKFINHPDLRRLMLTDEWEGYPLRKDYEDPINMIKL